MKNLQTHSRSSLFLMEMILAVLILALTSTACVQIFAAARMQRQKAREFNHIQELTTSIGEILEGWDGDFSSFVKLLPPASESASPADSSTKNTVTPDISTADSSAEDATASVVSAVTSCKLKYFYDSNWNTCEETSSTYTMVVQLNVSDTEKKADLNFSNTNEESLYQLSIVFPKT